MKKTVKGLLVISAVVSSFLTAQIVSADTISGTVTEISPGISGSIVVNSCTEETNSKTDNGKTWTACEEVTVYSLGPTNYWEEMGVPYPEVGDIVTIEAYEMYCVLDGIYKLVAYSVTVCDENNENCLSIALRDTEDDSVLWNP